jgi:hypothetical protein
MNIYTTHSHHEEHTSLVRLLLFALLVVVPLLSLLVARDVWQSGTTTYAAVDEKALYLPVEVQRI